MSQLEVNEYGVVTFHQPDPARGDAIQLEYWKWALERVEDLKKHEMGRFPPPKILNNLKIAQYHCEERIKFYTKRPTVMRSG